MPYKVIIAIVVGYMLFLAIILFMVRKGEKERKIEEEYWKDLNDKSE